MTIEKVINKYKKREEQPDEIWANIEMDELRRSECLCFNCGRKDDSPSFSSCPAAKKIYNDICIPYNMAMAITKCGAVDEKGKLLYKPLQE